MKTEPRPDETLAPPEPLTASEPALRSVEPVLTEPARPKPRFRLPVALQHRDFALLWGGQAVSQIGSQMQVVATAWLLWEMTHSALALGLVGLFRAVPLITFALFGGVIADAFDRRRLMLISQSVLLTLSVILAVATAQGLATPWLVYGFISVAAIANAFDQPARSALIPNLVPREHLTNALTLGMINFQVGTVIGPPIAGFLLAAFHSAAVVYTADAISFLAVIGALLGIRTKVPGAEIRQVSLRAAAEGLRFVRSNPIMYSTMTLDFFATLFGVAPLLMPVFADQVLHVGADGLGYLFAAQATGAVITSFIMSFLGHVERQGRTVLISVAIYGLASVAFGLSHNFWLSLAALATAGAADTVSTVMRQTIRQLVTPDEMRGRTTSVNMIFFMGGPQLGNLESGALAQLLGAGPATAISGIGVLAVVALTTALVPRLRHYRA
ncbi:MAG TPA: MFS transporter [Chloroflexia bacterium]|nr:MFS transporter [Chloroflexia bacterium]